MYLMDPEGEFVTFYGKSFTAQQLADSISEHLATWAAQHSDYKMPKPWSPPAAAKRA
jgi:protein SCO1/2